jgi:hypothetical protein
MSPNGPPRNYVRNIGGGFNFPPTLVPAALRAKPFPSETFNAGTKKVFFFY